MSRSLPRGTSRRRFCALFGLCVLGAGGCNTPTLPPLPPPGEPNQIQHLGNGEVLLQGVVPTREAKVLVLNTHTDEIVGVFTHDAKYSLAIRAQAGDFMHLWYSTEGLDSPLARFAIPEAAASEPADPADPVPSGDPSASPGARDAGP